MPALHGPRRDGPRRAIGRRLRETPALWRVWWRVVLLGLTTIVSYGFVLYSFGVFVVPIEEDTGWSTSTLSLAFSLSLLGGGLGAAVSGRLLDRVGSGPVMLGALVLGSALLWVSASAEEAWVFVVAWGVGGGIASAGLFYNVTMAITARLFFDRRAQAFAVLTFIGGLASPIYFPLAGALVEATDWRDTVRIMTVVMIVLTLPSIVLVRGAAARRDDAAPAGVDGADAGGYGDVREAFRSREVLQMVLMFALAMSAFSALQVYHVPAMQAAGLSLATATTIAGVRGFLSLPGRALLATIAGRAGVPGALIVMYGAMALGVAALVAAGGDALIWVFAVVTGLAFGTIAPLHGLFATEVFGERRIGTLMGLQSAIVAVASAAGPLLIGLTVDASDGYRLALAIVLAMFAASLVLMLAQPGRAAAAREANVAPAPGGD